MTAQVPAVEALNFWVSITHRGVAQDKTRGAMASNLIDGRRQFTEASPMRRSRSLKRESERRLSKTGSTLMLSKYGWRSS